VAKVTGRDRLGAVVAGAVAAVVGGAVVAVLSDPQDAEPRAIRDRHTRREQ
jgi:hypothetical protein